MEGKKWVIDVKINNSSYCFFLVFFRSKISSTKLVIFVVPGGTAIQSFDYLALNNLTRQLSRHPLNYVTGKTVIWRKSAVLFCEIVEGKIIKSVKSSATKHNKKNQCNNQLNLSAFLFISGLKFRRQHWFFLLCLVALLFTLLIIWLSTISQDSSADILRITSPEKQAEVVAQLLREVPLIDG